jgi:hypothetical protein
LICVARPAVSPLVKTYRSTGCPPTEAVRISCERSEGTARTETVSGEVVVALDVIGGEVTAAESAPIAGPGTATLPGK